MLAQTTPTDGKPDKKSPRPNTPEGSGRAGGVASITQAIDLIKHELEIDDAALLGLLRSWGKEHIARNTSCTQPLNAAAAGCSKPDRTWGGHGLTVKPAAAGKTEVWITDFYNHTVMAFDSKVGAILSLCHAPSASCIQ